MARPSTPYVVMSVKRDRTASMPTDGSVQRSAAPDMSAAPMMTSPTRKAWPNGSVATIRSPRPTAPGRAGRGHGGGGGEASPGGARPRPWGGAVSRVREGNRREPPLPGRAEGASGADSPAADGSAPL